MYVVMVATPRPFTTQCRGFVCHVADPKPPLEEDDDRGPGQAYHIFCQLLARASDVTKKELKLENGVAGFS